MIVVLDGYTLNPGDLSWAPLEALGRCMVHDRTPANGVVARARDAEILLTNKTVLGRAELEQLPRLRYIGVLATGVNVVDVGWARSHQIPVTNVPGYATDSVAQMVFAHLLNLTQHVGEHASSVARGDWARVPDFCYWRQPLVELRGLSMGIVGFGAMGRATARLALAFGMNVRACGRPGGSRPQMESVEAVDLETLLRESDVVSLHCPLTPQSERLINAERLEWMRPGALLINTSRGGLVDEQALAAALNASRLGGAGLDVLSVEPPPEQHPLYSARNCFITPHIGWATQRARQRLMDEAVANVAAFLRGERRNVVNG